MSNGEKILQAILDRAYNFGLTRKEQTQVRELIAVTTDANTLRVLERVLALSDTRFKTENLMKEFMQ